ncbi:Pentatricopeptide repeat-containing protein, partial [Thalictrum thalictroides]
MLSISRLLYRSFCTSLSSTATTTTPPTMNAIVDSIFKERNLTKLVQKFKKSSEIDRFRSKHRIYEIATRRLASAKKFYYIEEILEEQKKYHDITKEGFAIRLIKLYGNA